MANRDNRKSAERTAIQPQATQEKQSEQSGGREVPREQIEARAYERYRWRGSEDGHDLDDWLEAERELGKQKER